MRTILTTIGTSLMSNLRSHRKLDRDYIPSLATGGFKAEIAYAVLIGQLFDVPVYYIHEMFRDIIEIPPLPIQWDFSLLVNYEDFFEWIDSEPRTIQEAHSWLQGLPDEIRMLLTEDGEHMMLSPAGEAFLEAYHYELSLPGQQVMLSSRARRYYESLAPNLQEGFNQLIERLARANLRSNNIEPMRDSDLLVYPRRHRDERIVFYEQDGVLHICELARHSDQSYERLYGQSLRRRDYSEFEPL